MAVFDSCHLQRKAWTLASVSPPRGERKRKASESAPRLQKNIGGIFMNGYGGMFILVKFVLSECAGRVWRIYAV